MAKYLLREWKSCGAGIASIFIALLSVLAYVQDTKKSSCLGYSLTISARGEKGLTNGQVDVDISFLLHSMLFDDRICSLDRLSDCAL